MLNENAKKWVKALRSGEYAQGRDVLVTVGKQYDKFCCLGVACELYQQEVGTLRVEEVGYELSYNGNSFSLPPVVKRWLGLRTDDGQVKVKKEKDQKLDLVHLNDNQRWSFRRIADFIESEPEGLFSK